MTSDALEWDEDGGRALRLVRRTDGDQQAVTDGLYRHHHGRAAGVVWEALLDAFDLLEASQWHGVPAEARVLLSAALEECNQLRDDARRHDEALRVLTASAVPELLAATDDRLRRVAGALRDLTEGLKHG